MIDPIRILLFIFALAVAFAVVGAVRDARRRGNSRANFGSVPFVHLVPRGYKSWDEPDGP